VAALTPRHAGGARDEGEKREVPGHLVEELPAGNDEELIGPAGRGYSLEVTSVPEGLGARVCEVALRGHLRRRA